MTGPVPITIGGAFSSPYSMKMRAVLRYRRIPFRWVLRGSQWDDLPEVPVKIIPVLVFPDADGNHGETMVDSSPQIERLERDYAGRSLVPTDPVMAFLDFLVEDFADEWVTKMMYHYRWAYEPDIEKAGRLLPLDQNPQASDEDLARMHDWVIQRQVARREMVGSTEGNQPVIEGSYLRCLDILEQHLRSHHFLFGDRPARSDLALYGQLKPMLWWDPTPTSIAVERAPRVVNWIERVDDLSWWEVDGEAGWAGADALAPMVRALLDEVGSTYVPFMLANDAAIAMGRDEVVCEIEGREFRQPPFKYQVKCLAWIREAYAALDAASRSAVDGILEQTGCSLLVR